ncbi:DUF6681 family protein [Lacticaseibacillus brantae]|nr:DUF6681 family protein [Lacticaseibacillus brantae]
MLSFLDILNRMLGYFNIQDRPKGQVFTVVAFLGNFYLLYIAIQNLRYPDFRLRGAMFLLAFVVLLYFIILNFFYFFTQKTVPFDISPKIEKALGGNQQQKKAAEQAMLAQSQPQNNGLFADDQILPANVTISTDQQANLDQLMADLVTQGAVALNYQGLDDQALTHVAEATQQPVLAMGAPVAVPFFTLQKDADQFVIMGGLNALSTQPIGTITDVGLMPVAQATKDYDLALAQVMITGGESKKLGRSGLMVTQQPYTINVQVAYQDKPT